jgi:predicted ATPase
MNIRRETDNLVILSGCSGGGKSTLLSELSRRGHATIEEPGRRIVKQETNGQGSALPWVDMEAFARRAVATSMTDREQAPDTGWVFFDRGLIDAASALHAVCEDRLLYELKNSHRYNPLVFLTPPWPEIYVSDGERQHDFTAAIEEYERLLRDYADLGYETIVLAKMSVAERANFVLSRLGGPSGSR